MCDNTSYIDDIRVVLVGREEKLSHEKQRNQN